MKEPTVRVFFYGSYMNLDVLKEVEKEARGLGCCKLTLEVQENNHAALALYESFGFVGGRYEPEAGAVLFREKKL